MGLFPAERKMCPGGEENGESPASVGSQRPHPCRLPVAAKPPPLTKQQLLELVSGGVPNQRIAELLRDRGIDFQVDDDYVRTLRRAGAR